MEMKRFVSIVLILCCVFSVSFAADQDDGTMPLYDHIAYIIVSLDISDSGYAKSSGVVSLYPGYNVTLELELQKLDNGWTTIDSYTGSGSGPEGVYVYLDRYVVHGTYRAKVTIDVTNSAGSVVETVTETSYIKTY
nr:hypothetical protein [uncultured Agathobaculum sp.]